MRPALRYRLALAVLSPAIFAVLLYSARRKGGGTAYLAQRLGRGFPRAGDRPVWLHAASVGEVNAAAPLLHRLLARHPGVRFLVTTNTATGARTVLGKLVPSGNGRVRHCFLPVDFRGAVARFLEANRPRCGLIMETELWPNLYAECARRGLPLCLVNGRLSKKTLDMPGWLRPSIAGCLVQLKRILARGEADASAFIALGAPAESVRTVGNIKFARPAGPERASETPDPGRPYVLAASTHEGEEKLLAALWKSLNRPAGHLLVLAPRYPERRDAVLRQLRAEGLRTAVRSRGETVTEKTDVYLVDTLGELTGFMPGATLVFMGGSLVPRGGQNVLEPARLGKAVITGPHTFTFQEEIEALRAAGALVCVDNAEELRQALERLLAQPEALQTLGENARRFTAAHADIADKYAAEIEKLGFFEKLND